MLAGLQRNAALVGALVNAGVALVVSFGVHLTPEQVGALSALAAVVTGGSIQLHANVSNGK